MFEVFVMERNPYMSGNDQQILKDQQFAEWVKNYASFRYYLIYNLNETYQL